VYAVDLNEKAIQTLEKKADEHDYHHNIGGTFSHH